MAASREDIRKQIEYYLSDENLAQDEFFHEQITKDHGGYLGLHLILKCNKIKKLNITDEKVLADAVKDSQLVELNEAKTSARRKGQKPLPELNPKTTKKIKLNNSEGAVNEQQEPVENPYKNFEPLIFSLRAPEGVQVTWSQISEALMKQFNISSPYVRYGKTEGNFALNKSRTPQENIDNLTGTGIKVGEHTVQVTLSVGEVLTEFWNHHGKHYEGIIKRAKEQFSGKPYKEQKKLSQQRKKAKEIVFHNQKFKDINQLKNIFKTILARSENNTPLKEPYHSMLVELLNYHEKKDQKLHNIQHFTVGQHPDHLETRCFMVVKTDGTTEDFSCVKCITNLQEQLEKE